MSLCRWMMSLICLGTAPLSAEVLYQVKTLPADEGQTEVVVEPTAGVHVNAEAPLWIKVEQGEPTKGGTKGPGAQWQVILPPQDKAQIQLQFSLCDDANTWCKPIHTSLLYDQHSRSLIEVAAGPPTHDTGSHHPGAIPRAIQDDLNLALTQAQQQGSLVFIDFHGIWCPPCQMLATEGMSDPRVQAATRDMVLVQLDADKPSSWDAKSRYQVRGYPTIIVARADGTEIARMEGYPGATAFAAWLETTRKSGRSLQEWITLRNEGDTSPQVLLGLARGLTTLELHPEAAAAYAQALPSLTGPDEIEARLALLDQAAQHNHKKQVKAHTTTLLQADNLGEREVGGIYMASRSAQGDLADYLLHKTLTASELALTQTGRPLAEVASLHELRAAAWEGLNQPDQARAEYSLACDAWLSLEKALPGTGPERYATFRGQARSLTDDLHAAGRDGEADTLHQRLVAAFPHEFTYYYDYAAFLRDTGRLDEARGMGEKAVALSYGDNHLRSVGRLADILAKAGKTDEAIQLLTTTIAAQALPTDPGVRTLRYVDQLRKQLITLQGTQPAATNPSGTPARG